MKGTATVPPAIRRLVFLPAVSLLVVMLPATSAWAAPILLPSAPTNLAASRGEGELITVSWTASTPDAADSYTARAYKSPSGFETWDVCGAATGASTSCTDGDVLTVPRTAEAWIAVVAENASGSTSSATRVKVDAYPSAPTISTVSAASGSLVVTWAAGIATSPTPAATSFTATAHTSALGATTAGTACTQMGTSCAITGLTNGTTYYVAVVGSATVGGGTGTSDPSTRVAGTPVGNPSVPTSVTVQGGDSILSVSWGTPTDSGGSTIASYQASAFAASSGGSALSGCTPSPATGTSCTIEGLTNGITYYVSATATTAAGGTATSARVTGQPGGRPTAPRSIAAVRADGAIDVTWVEPASDGGSPITGYTASVFTSSSSNATAVGTCTTPSTGCTVGGLDNATTYYINVIATTIVGSSVPSARVTVSPSVKPTPPRSVVAERGNGFARISWQAPLNSGGNRISKYIVRAYATATSAEAIVYCSPADSQLRCNLGPLPNGTTYYVDVIAQGPLFTSDPSSPRVAVLPATQPSAPREVIATQVGPAVEVRWKVPVADGGQSITRYTATAYSTSTGTVSVGTCSTSGDACTISSLAGPPVYVAVTASNSVGTSVTSSPRVKIALVGAPSSPRDVTIERQAKSIIVRWLGSVNAGDSPITMYRAIASGGSGKQLGSCLRSAPKRPDATIECRILGIDSSVTGRVMVTAYNSRRETSTQPVAMRGAKTSLLAPKTLQILSREDSLVVSVDRSGADLNGVVYEFRAWSKPTGGTVRSSCRAPASEPFPSCTIDDLSNYESFWVDVRTVNGERVSRPSARLKGIPQASPPSAPRDVRAVSQSGELVVTWRAPLTDGGYAIRQSTVSVYAQRPVVGEPTATPLATCTAPQATQRCVIRGVTQEFVSVQVTSTNGVGQGTPSKPVDLLTNVS